MRRAPIDKSPSACRAPPRREQARNQLALLDLDKRCCQPLPDTIEVCARLQGHTGKCLPRRLVERWGTDRQDRGEVTLP